MDPDTNADDVLRALGQWGHYQKFQILLLFMGMWATGFQLLSGVVTGYRPLYECKNPYDGNLSVNANMTSSLQEIRISKCHVTMVTNSSVTKETCPMGYVYSIPKDRSFVTEWDLVCEGAERAELSQTFLMGGQMVGAAFFTSLSDRFGRKKISVFSNFGLFTVGLGIAYAPNYQVFAGLRFLIGALQQGLVMTGAIMTLELLPRESRFFTEVFGSLLWATGVCLLSLIGYLMRGCSWRTIQIVLSAYSGYSVIQYFIQEDSLRWLLINNKIKEAERIVRKAAKMNGLNYDDVIKKVEERKKEKNKIMLEEMVVYNELTREEDRKNDIIMELETKEDYQVQHYNATHIFREKRIFLNSLVVWIAWITDSLSYFALTLTSTSLAGDRYLNFFLMSVVEYPAVIIEYTCLNRIGRKGTTILFHMICGISLASATLCREFAGGRDSLVTMSLVFTLIGKMGATGAFSTMFLYTPEMYPTNLRNVGIGLSSSTARIGAMIAPFAGVLAMHVSWAPGTIVAALCFLVSFLVFLVLPETMGHELPKTMEELRQWYKDHSGRRSWKKSKQ
ncbi:hypothetical protein FSP39_020435 [Pinctada imbricata]|uniref:Major facilitator superfamily (MFS) profile domain-containing protein n=1 Tax=Pinctada imbricata TaxID=66713 RepID=A0AA88YS11_PINIB|nr:hypothetical protein FSP39_020435 [Pinctada imbricata]